MEAISAFDSLLAPVGAGQFFEHHWEQRSLLIKGGVRLPFAFSREAFFQTLPACVHTKVAFKDPTGQHREAPIDGAHAKKFYDAGLSICAAGLERGHAGIAAFLAALDAELVNAGGFLMNGYLSPADKGFGIHFDNHSVWVIQLEGAKRWFYGDVPEVPYPVTNCIYLLHRASIPFPWYRVPRPDPATLNEVLLEPGDVLYLPSGTWHMTEASGGSLSLTLAQQPVGASQFVANAVRSAAFATPAGRRFLPGRLAHGAVAGASADDVRDALADGLHALRDLLGRTTVEELYAVWEQESRRRASHPAASSLHTLADALGTARVV